MNKRFVRQARLPKGSITYDLSHTLSYFSMKTKRGKIIPRVYKSAFGPYYVLSQESFSQEDLRKAYEEQEKEEDVSKR